MEDAAPPELISPRISFSYDLVVAAAPPVAVVGRRSDASSRSSSRFSSPEPEFDFANSVAAADHDVAPADRLFSGGKLLPLPPLPPAPPKPTTTRCGTKPQQAPCRVKPQQQACQQQQMRRQGSWASRFSRSSSVNSATTTTTATTATTAGAPRSAGRFGCPPFPLMRSWSVGSSAAVSRAAAAAGVDAGAVSDAAVGRRPHHHHQYYKKLGSAGAATSSSRGHYYGGSRKGSGSGSHGGGVRVRPVLNVPFIGTGVSSVLSYLLCDCSHRTKKSREF